MIEFRNKTIFIISYENWGKMLMSKHHYAIDLARKGNEVYFINHPDRRKRMKRGEFRIEKTEYPGLYVVHHRMIHPYFLKFKMKWFYNWLAKIHIMQLISKVGKYPDIVWSFDAGNTIPLKYFPKSQLRIYMPVDGPFMHQEELLSAEGADYIFSVTPQILARYEALNKPMHEISHGVAEDFLRERNGSAKREIIRVGYSGSLVRNDLDTEMFMKIISGHPHLQFEFWGEYDPNNSTIHLPQDVNEGTKEFLATLHSLPNVKLHGPTNPADLATGLSQMDALIIAYRIKDAQNSHKLLEYLGTGKVIVSSYFSHYENRPELVEMVSNKGDNQELLTLFNEVIGNLAFYNSEERQALRRNYARDRAYAKNINRIQEFVNLNFR